MLRYQCCFRTTLQTRTILSKKKCCSRVQNHVSSFHGLRETTTSYVTKTSANRLGMFPQPTRMIRRNDNVLSGSSWMNISKLQQQTSRSYLYLPTSWKELKIRVRSYLWNWYDSPDKWNKIYVKLFSAEYQNRLRENWKYRKERWKLHYKERLYRALRSNQNRKLWKTTTTEAAIIVNQHNEITTPSRSKKQSHEDRNTDSSMVRNERSSNNRHQGKKTVRWNSNIALSASNSLWWRKNRLLLRSSFLTNTSSKTLVAMKNRVVQSSLKLRTTFRSVWDHRMNQMIIAGRRYRYRTLPVTLTEYAEPHWFDSTTGRPLTSKDETGRYVNPWMSLSSDGVQSPISIIRWQYHRILRNLSEWNEMLLPQPKERLDIPITNRNDNDPGNPSNTNPQYLVNTKPLPVTCYHEEKDCPTQMKFTWIGHSTCLVQSDGVTILTDPILSHRASPFQHFPLIGMSRVVPPSISCIMTELPKHIDIVMISHDHYDHLDKETCQQLYQSQKVKLWIVPLGLKQWLRTKIGIIDDDDDDTIIEMEWWESIRLTKQHDIIEDDYRWQVIDRRWLADHPTHPALLPETTTTESSIATSIWISCLPVQHWGSRTFFDRNYRLWSSFAIFFCQNQQQQRPEITTIQPKETKSAMTLASSSSTTTSMISSTTITSTVKKFYFGGDTALPPSFPLFEQIRDFVGGSVDLAALPIGAYEPNFFMSDAHMNPEEAVKVHQILQSKVSVGIHWGTFPLSEEPLGDPPVRLQYATQQVGCEDDFITIPIGTTIVV